MYGLVNQAIVDYVRSRHGEEILARVRECALPSRQEFLSMESYPDSDSVALVTATAEATGLPPEQVLEEIGEHWVAFVLGGDYGDILRMAGDSVAQVLCNLDAVHTRVGQAFEGYQPPSFWCTDVDGDTLTLHYQSHRSGLAPLVIGIVRGLGNLLGRSVSARVADSEGDTVRLRVEPVEQPARPRGSS